ncbi:MAG: pentapeptide repeat-containing protein [Limnospira sp.]
MDSSGNLLSPQILEETEEIVYDFWIKIVKNWDADAVLQEFIATFWNLASDYAPVNLAIIHHLNNEEKGAFTLLLKRSFYILINNWYINRKYQVAERLLKQVETAPEDEYEIINPQLGRLRNRVRDFLKSPDYQDIRHCAFQHGQGWSSRYRSYLLVSQYMNPKNSPEQQEVARQLSKQLREQYKFDLAMYVARSHISSQSVRPVNNPTHLGDEVLELLKKTISTQRIYSYTHQAELFIQATADVSYRHFKTALPEYLTLHQGEQYPLKILREKISDKLHNLYPSRDEKIISKSLTIRTCNRLIECLTTEDGSHPSFIFNLMMGRDSALTVTILLLKLILLSPSSQTHLELKISQLLQFYQQHEEERCRHFILFLETFNLVFTIFTENVQYHLVKIDRDEVSAPPIDDLSAYRLFCQFKGLDLRRVNFKQVNLRSLDLKGADLRGTDLAAIDLSELDLRLANLEGADLCRATLNGAQLFIVNLKGANLSEAHLLDANLGRADLRQANLSRAHLAGTNLHRSDLREANCYEAALEATNLENADLEGADLQLANLERACLTRANLQNANLRGVKLRGADLRGVNLQGADLSDADLTEVDLTAADLRGANLYQVRLDRANLSRGTFQNCNFSRARLNEAILDGGNFGGAKFLAAQCRYASLREADLTGADLRQTDLTRANLANANLTETNLMETAIRHTQLAQANLSGANLLYANLFGSNVTEATVAGAKFGNNSGLSEETRKSLNL